LSGARRDGGHWSEFSIIPCRDWKARRIEPGTFPLVARIPRGVVSGGDPSVQEAQATAEARAMRLKGYGNAIVPQLAAEFIQAAIDAITGGR
jgi:DNA (cytosine-5)-methyltransferase 1